MRMGVQLSLCCAHLGSYSGGKIGESDSSVMGPASTSRIGDGRLVEVCAVGGLPGNLKADRRCGRRAAMLSSFSRLDTIT